MSKQLQKLTRGRFAQLLHQSKARSAPARLSLRWALHPPRYFVLDPSLATIITNSMIRNNVVIGKILNIMSRVNFDSIVRSR